MAINGREYAWEDIQILFEGNSEPIDEVTAVEYKSTREFKKVWGRGKDPIRLQPGKKDYDASVTILQSALEALQQNANKGEDLTDLPPFSIAVSYTPEEGGTVVTDVLKHVRVKEVSKTMKAGDTHMEVKLPLVIGKIDYNV